MDWKKIRTRCCIAARRFWTAFLPVCGAAWTWSRDFGAKMKVWLRKALHISNIWLTKAWKVGKVWLASAGDFLSIYGKRFVGMMAVLVLKVRRWILKNTAQLKKRRAKRKEQKRMELKTEEIREKQPGSAGKPAVEEVPVKIVQEQAQENVVQTAGKPASRKSKNVGDVLLAIWKGFKNTLVWIYRLRKYIMAAPVAFFAVKLAIDNANRLPDVVGIDIQSSGEFAHMVSRQNAVLGPLGITAFCLVLLLCSRKPLLPWLISAFTLILPVLIWMTNYYA